VENDLIKGAWEIYKKKVSSKNREIAFYSGAYTMFGVLVELLRTNEPEKDIPEIMNSVQSELRSFFSEKK
jgi:hypothetical protein